MASRIFWILIAGGAVLGGMVLQDGSRFFGWAEDSRIAVRTERAIESGIERAVERSVDRMQVVDADGREIDVSADTKRALGAAVGELVEAEADLAILRIRDGDAEQMQAAEARSLQARAAVDQLKADMRQQEQRAALASDASAEDVQRQIRDEIRTEIRDAVRN